MNHQNLFNPNFNSMAFNGASGGASHSNESVVTPNSSNVNAAPGFYTYPVHYAPPITLMPVEGSTASGGIHGDVGDNCTAGDIAPNPSCELYIRSIPRHLNESKMRQLFERFGTVHSLRLPMDFQVNRGYAYVTFHKESDAICCKEVLAHYFVDVKMKLDIFRCEDKRRLFINNLPRHLTETEIEDELLKVFPKTQKIIVKEFRTIPSGAGDGDYKGPSPMNSFFSTRGSESSVVSTQIFHKTMPNRFEPKLHNRGFAIVEFATHQQAISAKYAVNRLHLWGREQKIFWARNDYDNSDNFENLQTKTLLVRNLDNALTSRDVIEFFAKYLPSDAVQKVRKSLTTAFVEFKSHDFAKRCFHKCRGYVLSGKRMEIEWPGRKQQSNTSDDFDSLLRMKCIANYWRIPIILFGTYFDEAGIQNVAVILRNADCIVRAIFCIMHTNELVDIHSRACEVACNIIDCIGTFPDYNYVFDVQNDTAHLVGIVTHSMQNIAFVAVNGAPSNFALDFNEIIDLSSAAATLANLGENYVLKLYNESFNTNGIYTYLNNVLVCGYRIFGTVYPKYRNKPPLKCNLNDSQIVLALCFASTGLNKSLEGRGFVEFPISTFDVGNCSLRYVKMKLQAPVESHCSGSYKLSHVLFGDMSTYHPDQRSVKPPFYLHNYSYQENLKQVSVPPLEAVQQAPQLQQQLPSIVIWPYYCGPPQLQQQPTYIQQQPIYVASGGDGEGFPQNPSVFVEEMFPYNSESDQCNQPQDTVDNQPKYPEPVPLFIPDMYGYGASVDPNEYQDENSDAYCAVGDVLQFEEN